MKFFEDIALKSGLFKKEETTSNIQTPSYFPQTENTVQNQNSNTLQPSFVVTSSQTNVNTGTLNPEFIKYFEDELAKANIPGMDYFEFRQLLINTQRKMSEKGVTSTEAILQAVLMTFEAQGINNKMLIDHATHYKQIIQQKGNDFVTQAELEKTKQLKIREDAINSHNESVKNLQTQIQQLDIQKEKLNQALQKEMTQMELNKNLGQEAIEKIDRASQSIKAAGEHMLSTIDNDIKILEKA